MLDEAARRAGRTPKYTVSDQGSEFGEEYLEWCDDHDVRARFGAVGRHGSIAVEERFIRTLPARLNPEARSKASKSRTTAASARARFSQRALESRACCFSWSNGSRRDDRAEATPAPGGSGGAWDLDVPGNDLGATTNDLFSKAMVIGPACPRQGRRGWCHRTSISHRPSKTSMIFSMPLLRTLQFGMSAFTAGTASRGWRSRQAERGAGPPLEAS